MTDLYDRLIACSKTPYARITREDAKQLAELYKVAKVEIAPALRREATRLSLLSSVEARDLSETLLTCAEDLERLTT